MIYDINISEKQVEYLKSDTSLFCASADVVCSKLNPHDFIRINSKDKKKPRIMTWIFYVEKFTCADELINHRIFQDKIRSEEAKINIADEVRGLFADNNEVFGIFCFKIYSDDNSINDISLYVITKFLYRSIMYFRHLQTKKKFFKYKIESDVEKRLLEEIDKAKTLLSVLKGEINCEEYIKNVAEKYKQNPPEDPELLSLLDLGLAYPFDVSLVINNIRMKLILDTEVEIEKIINAYEGKDYKKINKIGYDIHNYPEMIRNMNDWRDT